MRPNQKAVALGSTLTAEASSSRQYAFIALSKIRALRRWTVCPWPSDETSLSVAWQSWTSAVGRVGAMPEFQTAVDEIFDIQLSAGIRFPDGDGLSKKYDSTHVRRTARGAPATVRRPLIFGVVDKVSSHLLVNA